MKPVSSFLHNLPLYMVVTLGVSVLAGCSVLGGADTRTTAQRLADDAVEPAYQQWQMRSQHIATMVREACAREALDPAMLTDMRAGWREDALAWSYLQSMQPGPVTPVSVRVSYWPDKKDLVGHQVNNWLKQPVPTVAELSEQSVTLQGLSAMEFMLFDARFDWMQPGEKNRLCPRVQVIAERQQQLATETLHAWQQEQGAGMRGAVPNARYATESEALAEVLKANVSGLEVAHKKLVAALGEKYPQPYLAEYWRSGLSLSSARAVIEGSRSLWQSGLAAAVEKQDKALAGKVTARYTEVLENDLLAADPTPVLTELLKTPAGRESVAALANQMKDLHLTYARDVSKALQIPLGINAHDGD